MSKTLGNLHDWAIPSLPDGDVDLLRKHKLFVNTCLFNLIFGAAYGVMSYFIGFYTGIWTMMLSVVFFLCCIFLLRYVKINTLGFVMSLYTIWLNAILVYYSGGLFTSPVSPWITLTAPIVLLLTNRRTSYIVLSICILYVLGYYILIETGYEFPFTYDREKFHYPFLALAMAGLVAIFFLIANTFEKLKQQALDSLVAKQKELEYEQARSENLLLNIFPADIAEELKSTGRTQARLHDNVTVLFADVKNFTIVSEGLLPDQLVALLDTYFQRIDAIIQKHGLEKIKTIGDAYLAAGGVPKGNKATAKDVVAAALEIQKTNDAYKVLRQAENLPFFDFRIGINTGTVVAGVVGDKKYVYDIWGDAVNTAARIEENSAPGRVNISTFTYEVVKEHFELEERGLITAKNKGKIEMFWVLDHKRRST
ncbi:adenylate/guanylate cyclase domain-containing protein [Algoriphagus aestuarii]|nr:adenylate/guanylate cyclase domain-containing protein [Algoriphagus aestuarii]